MKKLKKKWQVSWGLVGKKSEKLPYAWSHGQKMINMDGKPFTNALKFTRSIFCQIDFSQQNVDFIKTIKLSHIYKLLTLTKMYRFFMENLQIEGY